ncbi:hypothetical protein [Staphylococcus auricularis]
MRLKEERHDEQAVNTSCKK